MVIDKAGWSFVDFLFYAFWHKHENGKDIHQEQAHANTIVSLLLIYTFPFMSILSICPFSLAYINYGSPLSLHTPHTPVLLLSSGVTFCTECFLLLPAGFQLSLSICVRGG